jgi:hypothetical protein
VDRRGPDECWPWTGGKQGKGYGQFYRRKGVPEGAHRFSWELANGRPIPLGRMVMHSCDNPPCVNPAHLSVGTCADNNRDKTAKGRNPGNRSPYGRKQSALDLEQVRALRAAGLTYKQMAMVLGVSGATVWRRLNK